MTTRKQAVEELRQIARYWADKIERGNDRIEDVFADGDTIATVRLAIGSHQFCIVGEAHGFSESYRLRGSGKYCGTCDNLSMDLCSFRAGIPKYSTTKERKKFFETVHKFVEHFKTCHGGTRK